MNATSPRQLPDVLIEQTIQHLMTLIEGTGLQLPPGQKLEVVSDRYLLTIQARLIVSPAGLVAPS